MDCAKCKYCDLDYIWDGEDEYPFYTCEKGHCIDTEDCEDFCEYKKREYKERNTKCDDCPSLSDCMRKHGHIDVTATLDSKQHFFCGNPNCER